MEHCWNDNVCDHGRKCIYGIGHWWWHEWVYCSLDATTSCPTCYNSSPSNFKELYCKSAVVYKLSTRKSNNARLLINMSPGQPVHRIRRLVKLVLGADCWCKPLEKGKLQQEYLLLTLFCSQTEARNFFHFFCCVRAGSWGIWDSKRARSFDVCGIFVLGHVRVKLFCYMYVILCIWLAVIDKYIDLKFMSKQLYS
jgi:hypothetical protein